MWHDFQHLIVYHLKCCYLLFNFYLRQRKVSWNYPNWSQSSRFQKDWWSLYLDEGRRRRNLCKSWQSIVPLISNFYSYSFLANTYIQVHTTVHNIILGKLWMENNGLMEIVNHKHGDKCTLEYLRASFFSNNDVSANLLKQSSSYFYMKYYVRLRRSFDRGKWCMGITKGLMFGLSFSSFILCVEI